MPAPSAPTVVAIGSRNATVMFAAPRRGVAASGSTASASPTDLKVVAYSVVWHAQSMGADMDPDVHGANATLETVAEWLGINATHAHSHAAGADIDDVDVSKHRCVG